MYHFNVRDYNSFHIPRQSLKSIRKIVSSNPNVTSHNGHHHAHTHTYDRNEYHHIKPDFPAYMFYFYSRQFSTTHCGFPMIASTFQLPLITVFSTHRYTDRSWNWNSNNGFKYTFKHFHDMGSLHFVVKKWCENVWDCLRVIFCTRPRICSK